MKRVLPLIPVLLLPVIASASTVWKGDFETGNLSQWTRSQSVSSDRLLVVSDVVREGQYALKATVHQGDDPIGASGNRNEVLYLTHERPGDEYFYKWSTLFPEDFPSMRTWQLFAQWHQDGCCGSPPLEFYVVGEEMFMRVGGSSGKVLWQGPLVRGEWNDFVLHVKWSSDPRVGFVELYRNGTLVAPKTMAATQFSGDVNYLKLGLYRDASISQVGVVYHDGFAMGTSLEDVMPPPAAPPVATPPPGTEQPVPPVAGLPTPPSTPGGNPPRTSETPGSHTTVPGDPGTQLGDGQGAQGCSAAASGGMPVVAGAALLVMAMLQRRRYARVQARSQRR